MAVVKANYVKRGIGDRGRAKSTIRYITHRRTRDNKKVTRELWGFDGELTKEQVYKMIDEAKRGTIFYRFVISPDPRREDRLKDLSIEDITVDTMIKLEERIGRQIQFVATLHDDHTNNRHTHVVALVKGRRLTREDFKALRQEATDVSLFQRRMRDSFLSHVRQQARARTHTPRRTRTHSAAPGYIRRPTDRAPFRPLAAYTCPICSHHQVEASTNRLFASPHRCPYCGIKMQRDRGIGLTSNLRLGREAG